MTFEQQAGVLGFVRLVAHPGTSRHLFDAGGAHRPADPPLDVVALLAERTVRTGMAELQLAFVIRSSGLRGEGTPFEPEHLEVAELDPCRTPFTGREHEDTVLAPRTDSDTNGRRGCAQLDAVGDAGPPWAGRHPAGRRCAHSHLDPGSAPLTTGRSRSDGAPDSGPSTPARRGRRGSRSPASLSQPETDR